MDYQLSKRLKFIASFVKKDMKIADIGSDHGYLPYYLLKNDIVKYVYASDNKKGPYNNLCKTLLDNFPNKVICALKDGLDDLPSEVDTLILSGMGGDLIINILTKGHAHLEHVNNMILSPQQNVEGLRRYLNQIDYKIIDEKMIFDDKYYFVLIVKKGKQELNDLEYKYGQILLREKSDTFTSYLLSQRDYFDHILNTKQVDKTKKNELISEIIEIDEILGKKNEFKEID